MQRLKSLPQSYRIVFVTAATLGALLVLSILRDMLADGVPAGFANKDFVNYWTAGKLVLSGRLMDLFGPQPVYFAHLQAAFGQDYQWHNWSYPPHYLLFVWPLGLLGYKGSMCLFLAASGAFYVWALRAFAGRDRMMALVAAGPILVYNAWTAQNGFLTAGFALGALALRENRPVLAGMLLACLTVKPQLGLLFPFLLLAERRWTMIASAALTAVALVALSAALFGVEAWRGYLDEVVPYQTFVMRELRGAFLVMLPSPYGAARLYGLEANPALAVHLLVAVPAAVLAVAAFFVGGDARMRAAVLLIGTFVVTPYALTYDLGMAAAGLALLAERQLAENPAARWQAWLIAAAMLVPVLMMSLGSIHVALAQPVMLAAFCLALWRSGLFDWLAEQLRRLAARGPAEGTVTRAASSPAAASD